MLRVEALHPTHGCEHIERCINLLGTLAISRKIYLSDYTSTDPRYIWPWREQLRERLHLSTVDREYLMAWRVRPYDKTDEQLAKYNRDKRNAKRKLKRRKSGMKSRSIYESYSISRLKPWISEGISESTWWRKPKQERETSMARVLAIFIAVQELDSQNSHRDKSEGYGYC